ncbi:hypothetical protein LXL04_003785 [Taraxacum kok-saghyz]
MTESASTSTAIRSKRKTNVDKEKQSKELTVVKRAKKKNLPAAVHRAINEPFGLRVKTSSATILEAIKFMTGDQKDAVVDMGFGALLNMNPEESPAKLRHFLVENLDDQNLKQNSGKDYRNKCLWDNFKLNFIALFAKHTLVGFVKKNIVCKIASVENILELDWCSYVLNAVRGSKNNWVPYDSRSNYAGPIAFLVDRSDDDGDNNNSDDSNNNEDDGNEEKGDDGNNDDDNNDKGGDGNDQNGDADKNEDIGDADTNNKGNDEDLMNREAREDVGVHDEMEIETRMVNTESQLNQSKSKEMDTIMQDQTTNTPQPTSYSVEKLIKDSRLRDLRLRLKNNPKQLPSSSTTAASSKNIFRKDEPKYKISDDEPIYEYKL